METYMETERARGYSLVPLKKIEYGFNQHHKKIPMYPTTFLLKGDFTLNPKASIVVSIFFSIIPI